MFELTKQAYCFDVLKSSLRIVNLSSSGYLNVFTLLRMQLSAIISRNITNPVVSSSELTSLSLASVARSRGRLIFMAEIS